MKILLFANTDWYLYNFRLSLASSLRDEGHEVTLLSPVGVYSERLKTLGFNWVAAPLIRRSLNPVRELIFLLWLRKFIINNNIELVHGFTIKCSVYGSLAAKMSGDRARVSAIAGLGYIFSSNDLRATLIRPILNLLMRLALDGKNARLILQNPDDRSLFLKLGIVAKERIRLIKGSGVDCSKFKMGGIRKSDQTLNVLLASRLLWDKGIAEYIDAARLLIAQGKHITFYLAGEPDDGNPNSVPLKTVETWVNQGLITWLGHVDDMAVLLGTMHVMVLPTAYGEGVPRSLIEGAASGLPLVTTDAPGCREIVRHEVEGLLVPLRDSAALANAISRLEGDPELCLRLGNAGRLRACEEFSERRVIHDTLSVYKELID